MAQGVLTAVPDAKDGKKQVTELSKSARVCFSRGSLSQANQATLAAAESSGQLAGFSINPQGELEPIQAASDNWFSKRRLKAELKKRANAGQAVQLMSSLCGNETAVTTPEAADPTQLSKVGGSGSPGATSTVAGAGGAGGAAAAASTSGLLVTGGLVGVGFSAWSSSDQRLMMTPAARSRRPTSEPVRVTPSRAGDPDIRLQAWMA